MAMIALMDQYLSFIETVALPSFLKDFNMTAEAFSWWEAVYYIPTFFIFLLNGLTDIIGRKYSILILFSMMGFASLGMLVATPSFHFFMLFLSIITFTTVSNMWTIPVSEESPADRRAKIMGIVYGISLIPLPAILPFLINKLGLGWRWYYGAMFLFMIPVFLMWIFMKEPQRYQVIKEERRLGKRKKNYFGIGAINRTDLKYLAFSAAVWMCWLIVSLIGGKYVSYYFVTVHGFPQNTFLLIFLGILLLMMVGSFIGGWTMDKIGRKRGFLIGCLGLAIFMALIGLVNVTVAQYIAPMTGFFLGFSYTWIIVYIPEIFPTDRRGALMGWTTAAARGSYIIGPVVAAILLGLFPQMQWFWVISGLIMLIPIVLVLLFHPYETTHKELEVIETQRET